MSTTKALRSLLGALGLLATFTGLMPGTSAPATAEENSNSLVQRDVHYVGEIDAQAIYEVHCYYPNSSDPNSIQILFSPYVDCYHEGAYGVAELRLRDGGYRIEICNFSSPWLFYETIDPANPDGSSSGRLLWYSDAPGGGCFIRNIGYPVRKFRAEWNAHISVWDPPPG